MRIDSHHLKRFLFFVTAYSLIIQCALAQNTAPSPAQQLSTKIDEYMNAAVKAYGFSGSILVAHEGKIIARRGYGLADAEHDVPNAPETKFRIGSLTKPFTAAAILLLQERGNTPVLHKYGYGFAIDNIAGHRMIGHDGGINGFASCFFRFPDDGAVVIVLSNNEAAPAVRVAADLAAIIFGDKYKLP